VSGNKVKDLPSTPNGELQKASQPQKEHFVKQKYLKNKLNPSSTKEVQQVCFFSSGTSILSIPIKEEA
jgi:hypothetical protein